MKKFLSALCVLCLFSGVSPALSAKAEGDLSLTKGCKAAYLMDCDSGECIYSFNETDRMPIASVCKVMTLTLCFDAIEEGKAFLDDEVTISSNASGMGGSQIFLENGYSYPLNELIKSIVVCSANDSCVAVAEKISGSEDQFVADMNQKAMDLGCSNTLFANCTGLPKETQYSCARDVAVMFANLIRHKEYFDYSKIWLEDFSHGNGRTTSMTNTNKLIRRYNPCDGGKTGFTGEAGFCLASTAFKDNLRLVSVVLGADTSEDRFSSAVSMFDYGFANYKNKIILDKNVTLNDEFCLKVGKKQSYAVYPERNAYL
ncbi:MAG: D-alanyl-D-alanine carboxypeptidase [Clostridia bacterium]|nr:D-alanyl-D-alanine carboxypeptidase [Clostridia bacterium]